ncbi:hypothetical protein [Psychroflexus aestuariivivens]|uniref:hypothetical protein n=1 Tax=Psychroflexus aestuariivivens TaxID=1795040 RepID=UPI000FDAC0D4|nr:hypothetical protein [Psychroflexus aestuariivivens]
MSSLKIESGKVFVNEKETKNAELIGYAVLDLADENKENLNILDDRETQNYYKTHSGKSVLIED